MYADRADGSRREGTPSVNVKPEVQLVYLRFKEVIKIEFDLLVKALQDVLYDE